MEPRMIPRRRGRPVWIDARAPERRKVVAMRAWWTWRVALAFLLLLPLAGACKKKGPRPGEEGGAGAAGNAFLERAKRGLGPEENGILGDVHFAYDSYELDSTAR